MVRYTRILTTYVIGQTIFPVAETEEHQGGISFPTGTRTLRDQRNGLGRTLLLLRLVQVEQRGGAEEQRRARTANRNGQTISSEAPPAPKHRSISLEERAGDCRRPARRRSFPARCSGRLVNQWSRFQRALLLLVNNVDVDNVDVDNVDAEVCASLGRKPKGRVVPNAVLFGRFERLRLLFVGFARLGCR